MNELSKLRKRLAEARKTGKRTAPICRRLEIAKAAIQGRQQEGLSRAKCAEQLGMSRATLCSWIDLLRQHNSNGVESRNSSPRILPIEIEPELEHTQSRQPSARLPSGMVVVGLSIVDIAALERALS